MGETTQPRYRQPEQKLDSALASLEESSPPAPEIRRLALATAAAAAGRRDTSRAVLKVVLGRGTDPARLREALLQTYLFAGYPRAINALSDLTALLPAPDRPPVVDLATDMGQDRSWLARGQALCRRVYGPHYDRLLMTLARISPDLGRWMVVEGYGKVLSRPELDAKTRELTAVASLAVLDVPDQLRAHLRGALFVGAEPEEIRGVLDTAALVAPEARSENHSLFDRVSEQFFSRGGDAERRS